MDKKTTSVVLLSGFLGTGKTTFLLNILDEVSKQGINAAILLNELGDVHVEGQQMNKSIPTAELLGGCICCTSKGDLTGELHQLVVDYHPDLIIVESTGVAHPFETIDAITELSLYMPIKLCDVITLVDSKQFLLAYGGRKSETSRLMKEQIACASRLVLNKMDLLEADEAMLIEQYIRDWNKAAVLHKTVRAKLDSWAWLTQVINEDYHTELKQGVDEADHYCNHEHGEACTHHSHHHVMSYTHYFQNAINSDQFELWLKQLPENIYRAKGIVSFSDIPSRFLFQFAYRETDFVKITPQGEVLDVAVFIGEHFDKQWLIGQLEALEQQGKLEQTENE